MKKSVKSAKFKESAHGFKEEEWNEWDINVLRMDREESIRQYIRRGRPRKRWKGDLK